MKKYLFLLLSTFIILSCNNKEAVNSKYKYEYLYEDLQFNMPYVQRPTFPDRHVNLLDYGGNPDGITLNTCAFADAMQDLSKKGGGTLIVPKGIWFT